MTHLPAAAGLGDEHVELGVAEVAVARIVARRQHATARADLDDVGAGAQQLANLLAHLLWPVDDVVRLAGVRTADDARKMGSADLPVVAVTAGLAEDR